MEDSVTQSELNTVINNLNSNIVNTGNNITNNLVGTANNLIETGNNLQSQISLNRNTITTLETKINDNEERITSNNTIINDHESRITSNTTTINDHEERITSNNTIINDHEARITSNTTTINDHEARIISNRNIIDYLSAGTRGDIIYIDDVMNWGSVKVSNYIVAKLIQQIYPEKAIIASNGSIGGFSQETIHRKIGTGNVTAPCFDAEFWGTGVFAGATTDAINGVTQNIILSSEHDALQLEGAFIPDWVLDSGLPGIAALKSIVTDPLFDSNWGSTPPAGLVTAINNVIASNPGFGNYYAAPTWWGHVFETQSTFDTLGINVTVQYPTDGADYGYTDFLSILQTKGSQPDIVTGDNLFWGYSWIPNWSGTFGTTFVWSAAPQNVKIKKLRGSLFELQFPAAIPIYDAVKFTSNDIAEFAYDTELSGMTTVEAGNKWLAANTTRTAAWVAATTIVTPGRIQAMETTITDLQTIITTLQINVSKHA